MQMPITIDQVIDRSPFIAPSSPASRLRFCCNLSSLEQSGNLTSLTIAQNWQSDFFESTFGATPELSERPAQVSFDQREELT